MIADIQILSTEIDNYDDFILYIKSSINELKNNNVTYKDFILKASSHHEFYSLIYPITKVKFNKTYKKHKRSQNTKRPLAQNITSLKSRLLYRENVTF